MTNVVSLKRPPRQIWVCKCGCSSFELFNTNDIRCALCGTESEWQKGGWFEATDLPIWSGGQPTREISGNGDVEFVRRVTQQRSMDPDAVAVVVIKKSGVMHAWCSLETKKQRDWLARRLRDVKEMLEVGK